MTALVFVPGVGFRAAAARTLVGPVEEERGEWSVTIERVIAGPDSTEIGFALAGPMASPDDPDDAPRAINDPVRLREPDGRVLELLPHGRHGPMGWSAPRESSIRAIRRTLSFGPLTPGVSHIDVLFSGAPGDWAVPVELAPVTVHGLPAMQTESADAHHGVVITARAIARSEAMTAIDVHTSLDPTPFARFMRCFGTKGWMRGGPPQFTLEDDTGSTLGEFASFRDTVASGRELHEILVFPAVGRNATMAVLSVPDVRLAEVTGSPVTLPVPSESDIELGRYQARARITRAQGARGNVVRVELDDGGWHDGRRLIYPESVRVDGRHGGISWSGPLEPPVAVDAADPTAQAREVTLESPVVQLHGPWRLEIPINVGASRP